MIKIMSVPDYEAMGLAAARIVAAQVRIKPNSVLGLATGSSQIGLYKELIRLHREEGLDFSLVTTINLDEYCGLPGNHPGCYRYFMDTQLFNYINIDPKSIFVPDGNAEDIAAHCEVYDGIINSYGGTDIQVLGIGENGHIAFNEPNDSHFMAKTHEAKLTEDTIRVNSRFFDDPDETPRTAITMGMEGIMSAKIVIMLASGIKKADAVYGMVRGEVTPRCPASILQLHPNVILIADTKACSRLE
ncbi:MAG TPA: glucosamine-6-phosphate deaminase [Bacillota bacterium]|nr:glucosamine-6-phosphate deaminase [Bacillota bacterium]